MRASFDLHCVLVHMCIYILDANNHSLNQQFMRTLEGFLSFSLPFQYTSIRLALVSF